MTIDVHTETEHFAPEWVEKYEQYIVMGFAGHKLTIPWREITMIEEEYEGYE